MKNKDFPDLEEGQFALVQFEASTGIAFNIKGDYYVKEQNVDKYLIVNSIEEAKAYIFRQNKQDIEYILYNNGGEQIYHREVVFDKPKNTLNPWWKFW